VPLPSPSVRTESGWLRWNSSSQVPSPSEPTISAMMLAVMKIFSACRPMRLSPVPQSRIASAMSARCPPVGAATPAMLAMNPAAPRATVAIAITRVHM
jgi:hypothetical protein